MVSGYSPLSINLFFFGQIGISLPEGEEGLLCESGASGRDGEHEGGDPKGGVDGNEWGAEGGGGRLTAQQQDEAEEANHKLEDK